MSHFRSGAPGGLRWRRALLVWVVAVALLAGGGARVDGWGGGAPGGVSCEQAASSGGCVAGARAAREALGSVPASRRAEVRGLSAVSQRPGAPVRTALLALAAGLLGLAALCGRVVR